ncbi:helix-turn-helix domain-containing protein [Streptomyces asoensis]|uniref:Transcriptional regulator n=1 Tax=Streptomyces asoensis TaxID=249586 RepID=A0ABQ3S3L9_9ACTN|nr:helix-turn-helix transcriptional regulator [Streptomyces asoensis]GGR00883.1 transcriptional regulator [Streptomyces asoensis]GHI62602.1 transcriptional regulator [Streptomyces asoensis]
MSATEFAELLRELKERSGLSYGTLSKRLHMSTSTLHRYCNGDAVPTDYAPVERLARLCKASPQELVELHRRWVLADAVRGRKPEPRGTAGTGAAGTGPGTPDAHATPTAEAEGAGAAGAGGAGGAEGAEAGGAGGAEGAEAGGAGGAGGAAGGGGRRVRRSLVLAGAGAAAALGSVVLALALTLPGGGSGDGDDGRPAGNGTSVQGRGAQGTPSSPASASASVSVKPSASAPAAGPASPSASAAASSAAPGTDAGAGDSVPLTVSTRPYAWIDPCSQHYLIERGPEGVKPPPVEQDAPAWVARHRAVSAGEQFVQITVQGTGEKTVVVESLTVRTVAKAAPLAWNDYAMGYPGVGCGGGMPTRAFSVALDAARPSLVPEAGHRDFPFTVSESDPEVYYVTADASAYDVRWYLELAWSSGSRHGTVTIDDEGKPFRTSGNNGRPDYEFPLGGFAWNRVGAATATP